MLRWLCIIVFVLVFVVLRACVRFPYRAFSDPTKCSRCKKFRPFVEWDFHDLCPACRRCSKDNTCQTCVNWSSSEWNLIKQRSEERGKSIAKKKSSKASSIPSAKGSRSRGPSASASDKCKSGNKLDKSGVLSRANQSKPGNGTNLDKSGVSALNMDSTTGQNSNPPTNRAAVPADPVLTGRQTEPSGDSSSTALVQASGQPDPGSHNPVAMETEDSSEANRSRVSREPRNLGDTGESGNIQPSQSASVTDITGVQDQTQGSQLTVIQPLTTQDSAEMNTLAFSSDINSNPSRDFEGFSDRSRSRHRSKSKKKRRRHHSSSSSSSSERGRHHRRHKHRQPDPVQTAFPTQALAQLVALLSQSVDRVPTPPTEPSTSATQASSSIHQTDASVPGPSQSVTVPETPVSDHDSADQIFPEDQESSVDQFDVQSLADPDLLSGDSEDESPLMGTAISKEAFDKAVEVIRRQLGFDSPPEQAPSTSRKSHLSLNKPCTPARSTMPVDAECLDRFDSQAKFRKWRPYPRKQSSDFFIEESDWKSFFSCPSIPEACMDKLRSSNVVDNRGKFRSSSTRKVYSSLHDLDAAARTGMKFSSSLLLIAEVLSKSFRQSGSDEVSRKDTGTVVNILGPVARLSYDQFAKVAVKATRDRRELILDSIRWPSEDIKQRFMKLPLSGPDLFAGKFEDQLLTEIKRRKDINKANFDFPKNSTPAKSRGFPRRFRGRGQSTGAAFPPRQPSNLPRSQRGRPRNQPQPRNPPPSVSNTGRRPGRGSFRGSSRPASRFQSGP